MNINSHNMKTLYSRLLFAWILATSLTAKAQSTVTTGNSRNVLLESTTSVFVGFTPHAYCIQDTLRPNSNLIVLNYHLNFGSQFDTLYNSTVSSWMGAYNMSSIPIGLVNREPYNSTQIVARNNWGAAFSAQAATSPQYKLTMSASRKGQQLRIFLEGTSLSALTGEYRFNAIISEDSLPYDQTNSYTTGYCAYMSGGTTLTNFMHRDVVRNAVAGTYGNVAATNPAQNRVDTMSLYFTIPAHYNINRLRITGFVLKYGGTASQRTIVNAVSMKVSDACHLEVASQPGNQQAVEGNNAQFTVTPNASASFQWQLKNGGTFQNLTNSGQYSGTNTGTLTVSAVTLANQGNLYRCVVTSGTCADTSQPAQLNVLCGTQISTQPTNQQTTAGNTATFSLGTITAQSQKQWQTNLGTGFTNLYNAGQYSGVTTDQLQVSNTGLSNNNQLFRCILSNGTCYDTSATVQLSVNCGTQISTQPANTSVQVGNTAQFTVNPINGGSTFQWQIDAGVGFQSISNAGQFSGVNTSSMSISSTTMANNNQLFRCIVSFSNCTDTSNVAKLTVNSNPSGIAPAGTKNGLIIFPNPAVKVLHIEVKAPQLLGEKFYVFDLTGRIIFSGQLVKGTQFISIENWQNGIYLLQIGNLNTRFQVLHD